MQALATGDAPAGFDVPPPAGPVLAGPEVPPPAGSGRVLQRRGYAYRADGVLTGVDDLLVGRAPFGLDPAWPGDRR